MLISSSSPYPVLPQVLKINILYRRLFYNAERARTCNSVVTKVPGMFASVNNSTDSSGQIIGYISNAGIPSIANQTVQELDVITPYSVFPLVLFDKAVGMAWWKNIVDGKKMQSTSIFSFPFYDAPALLEWPLVAIFDFYLEQIRMEAASRPALTALPHLLSSLGTVRSRLSMRYLEESSTSFERRWRTMEYILNSFQFFGWDYTSPALDTKLFNIVLTDAEFSANTGPCSQVSKAKISNSAYQTSRFRMKGCKITQIVNRKAQWVNVTLRLERAPDVSSGKSEDR